MPITDADREAAESLRVTLADICGFWHKPGDESPLCQALARHREAAEARLGAKHAPIALTGPIQDNPGRLRPEGTIGGRSRKARASRYIETGRLELIEDAL